jgi:hypothetical protein
MWHMVEQGVAMLNPISVIEQNPDREEIEQVRILLFGEIQRENERRLAAVEAQLRDLRQTVERQMAAMAAESAASHASFARGLGDAIAEFGHRVSSLTNVSSRDVTGHE